MAEIAPLKLFLELLSIPYKAEDIAEKCKDVPSDPVQAIKESLEPTVIPTPLPQPPQPSQQGGKVKRKTRKLNKKHITKKTRRFR
jgi:hypothetical protein